MTFSDPLSSLDTVAFEIPKATTKHHVFSLDPADPTRLILSIDNSSLERFQTCPRSAALYIIQRREINSSRIALDYGSAIHAALADYLVTNSIDSAILQLRTAFETITVPAGDYRDLDNAISLIKAWVRRYSPLQFRPIMHEGAPFVERSFNTPIAELQINNTIPCSRELLTGIKEYSSEESFFCSSVEMRWSGRIDSVVEHDMYPGIWVMDHKTTSMGGPTYFNDFVLAQQMVGYCWAIRQLGISPKGMLLDALVNRKPTKSGVQHDFDIKPYEYQDWHYAEWKQDVTHYVADFMSNLIRGVFPKATKWCAGKYGMCSYHQVCTQAPTERESLLSSDMYRNVDWNPLAD